MPESDMLHARKTIDTEQARELAQAVFEQGRIVEDLVRDADERFAELTRRMSSIEQAGPRTAGLATQAASRDMAVANAVNDMRAKTDESTKNVTALRTELNKWEAEINDRFGTLAKAVGRSTSSAMDSRLLDMETKIKAMDTTIDGVEQMIMEISAKTEAVASKAAGFDRLSGEVKSAAKEAERKMQVAVSGMTDSDKRFSMLESRISSVEARIQKIVKIAIHMGPRVIE